MITAVWILGIGLAVSLFLIAVAVGGNRDLADENRKLRQSNSDLVFEAVELRHENARLRQAYIAVLAHMGIDAVDTTDLEKVTSPADIKWGGQ